MRHIFVDFEMCMVPRRAAPEPHMHFEIIQFGAVMLDEKLNFTNEYSCFVKPQYGELTPEMTELTGITEEMLANESGFIKAFSNFLKWLGEEPYTVYSWSRNDLVQLKNETRIKKFPVGNSKIFSNWKDFQQTFTRAVRLPHPTSLGRALELVQLEFVGSKHFADADAYNTARLFRFCAKNKEFGEIVLPEMKEENMSSCNCVESRESIGEVLSAEKLRELLNIGGVSR